MKIVLLLLVTVLAFLPIVHPYSDYPQDFITKYTIYDSPKPLSKPHEAPKSFSKAVECPTSVPFQDGCPKSNFRVVCARNQVYSGHDYNGNLKPEVYELRCREEFVSPIKSYFDTEGRLREMERLGLNYWGKKGD